MTYRYRVATADHTDAILAVLEEVAPEIPLLLISPEQKGAALECVQRCCGSGETWIALDRNNQVVGFLLAEPDIVENSWGNLALELPYGGVRMGHRRQHIFPALVAKVKERGIPLTATVKHSNKCDMLGKLGELGFRKAHPRLADQDDLRWEP